MERRELLQEDAHLMTLRLLEKNPQMTQRELAQSLGVSLGKANYCVQALLHRGLIKLSNFQNSRHKLAYAYYLTPAGFAEKSAITARFLMRKIAEYEQLQADIEQLRYELDATQQVSMDTRQSEV